MQTIRFEIRKAIRKQISYSEGLRVQVFIVFFLIVPATSTAQELTVAANNSPLNEVLLKLSDSYGISFSFDDKRLSGIRITVNQTYSEVHEALSGILKDTNLEFEKVGDVWIIFPTPLPSKIVLSGIVRDVESKEALPYAHVLINEWTAITDISGNFSFSGNNIDSVVKIKVSHLGYYKMDTVVSPSAGMKLELIPSSIGLSEIEIKGKTVETKSQFGNQAGLIKLNHKIAHFLPGYGDNSVFNLIRLMPGVLASGEQSSELIIWGSYEGQSEVIFDGFTVFGLKNFNDNISSFNPLLAKDIEIHKGGYDVNMGGRVGGIVNIIGKNGNTTKPAFTFTINNMTLNGMLELPVTKRSSLIIALRHTYYNLYNPSDMNALVKRNNDADSTNDIDITIKPDYIFRDANLKYSSTFKNNDLFFISLHGADDRFNYNIDEKIENRQILKFTEEENIQFGGTAYYGHNWNNGNITDIRVSYSLLKSDYYNDNKVVTLPTQQTRYINNEQSENKLEEYTVRMSNKLVFRGIHNLVAGLEVKQNEVFLDEYTFEQLVSYSRKANMRYTGFIQDRISPNQRISMRIGMRITHVPGISNFFVEPRFGASFNVNGKWKFNAAVGIYNQYITLSTITDELGNYRYFWTIGNNDEIPINESLHFVLGTKYNNKGFTFSLEGYYKTISGLTRYYNLLNYNVQDIFYGSAVSFGTDLLLKQEFRKHSAWIAYSLGKTMETFEYNGISDIRRAPQDQRHEIKVAMMLNFDPVYFSTNYVYGSGFPYKNGIAADESISRYSRLDVSLIYKILDRKVRGEAGLSVLNVLNTKNVKYQSFARIPSSQVNQINIIAEAIPFTPTLYLKFML